MKLWGGKGVWMWDRVIYAFWANRIFWPVGTRWTRQSLGVFRKFICFHLPATTNRNRKIFHLQYIIPCLVSELLVRYEDFFTKLRINISPFVIGCKTNLLQEKNKHVICRLRSVRMVKNCDLGCENAALGHSFSPYGPPSRQITYIYVP